MSKNFPTNELPSEDPDHGRRVESPMRVLQILSQTLEAEMRGLVKPTGSAEVVHREMPRDGIPHNAL